MADANTAAAKAAAKAAGQMTGLEVKYSPSRAKAICELVTPAQGENLAAVFTDKMAVQLINSLREATVATLRDQAVIGGTLKDMKRDLADRWALAAKVENPTFTDASGRRWDTQTYFQMNVRTNTMRVYNDCLVDDVAREVGSNRTYVSNFFNRDAGATFYDYVNNLRIEHACHLLRSTSLTIADIAQQSGFNSSQAFIRVFVRIKGITPSEHRAANT